MPVKQDRIFSIDVFRGLTIFMMIFVNDLASVKNIPLWMKHMPTEIDGMTFVDLVFPAFLFIVGMSIPLAITKRESSGDSPIKVWLHIIIRTVGLLVLGLFFVNTGKLNPEIVGISKHLWLLIFLVGVILVWNQYPKEGGNKILYLALRIFGVGLLLFDAIIYRSGTVENPGWFNTYWWGILGLIGWAYFSASLIYYIVRKNLSGHIGILTLLILLYVADQTKLIGYLDFINDTLWLGGHIGGHTAIALAGVVTTIVFTDSTENTGHIKKTLYALLFALFLAIMGYFLRPLYGISKDLATPSWSLYSSAISIVIFTALYWIIDVFKQKSWADFLKPAGSNPLLAYILPDIFYALISIFGITVLSEQFGSGAIGFIRSIVFSFLMLVITSLLSKLKIRLHL